jgi:hypothetical protein
MIIDERHLVRRRGYQTQHVNRCGDRWTAGDLTVESRTPVVSRHRHRDKRRLGDLRRDSHQMMRRQQRETSDHDLVQQLNNRPLISIQLICVCLVTVIFVVTRIHQAVNFVRPLIFNFLTVQKWAIWLKCVVVDRLIIKAQNPAVCCMVNCQSCQQRNIVDFSKTVTFQLIVLSFIEEVYRLGHSPVY